MTSERFPPEHSPTFLLFVAGDSPNSRAAIANLNRALVTIGGGVADVEIVDVYEQPDRAAAAHVLVTPTLLRRSDPQPRVIGDLSIPGSLVDFLR